MKTQLADLINKGFWTALDWIYPPVCAGCGEPGFHLCDGCYQKIRFRRSHYCKICGQPFQGTAGVCQSCQNHPPIYKASRCLADYEGVTRECIHALKYQKNQSMGHYFSDMMADLVLSEEWQIDLIVPVPLSPQRKSERGYNQALHLAKPLASRLGVACNPFGLRRVRNTRSQVGLSAEERHLNVAGAFEALPDIVRGKCVLVVDDVMTTGSTLSACAEALSNAGAHPIYCLALAGHPDKQNISVTIDHLV